MEYRTSSASVPSPEPSTRAMTGFSEIWLVIKFEALSISFIVIKESMVTSRLSMA